MCRIKFIVSARRLRASSRLGERADIFTISRFAFGLLTLAGSLLWGDGSGIAVGAELGAYDVQIFFDVNYGSPGPTFSMDPGAANDSVEFISGTWLPSNPLLHLKDRILKTTSSMKLGQKAGVVILNASGRNIFTKDSPNLQWLGEDSPNGFRIYSLYLFDRTKWDFPPGVTLTERRWQTILGAGLTNRCEFFQAPVAGTARPLFGTALAVKLRPWMQIHGKDVAVGVTYKNGLQKTHRAPNGFMEFDLKGDLEVDYLNFIIREGAASSGIGLPLVVGKVIPGKATVLGGELSGVWHSNLGDVTFSQEGMALNGLLNLSDSTGTATIVGQTSGDMVRYTWIIDPFRHGHGTLKVAADKKKMSGDFIDQVNTQTIAWNLWR